MRMLQLDIMLPTFGLPSTRCAAEVCEFATPLRESQRGPSNPGTSRCFFRPLAARGVGTRLGSRDACPTLYPPFKALIKTVSSPRILRARNRLLFSLPPNLHGPRTSYSTL
ncbi:hypothetical protein N658DRAFT_172544 [Parathielavia hyrcaniae]|uniref:Uncharacterized protein n=1 Tax=Parathielavia hyrcaniae TaxID=113614 RepID=A0AAN6SZ83_9PEZI|nr:hypothetical protein N658DRAFT_172544 [Parathielavia hyrcaniae]